MTWQPIESAPKDGKPFLAYRAGSYPAIARWRDGRVRTLQEEIALLEHLRWIQHSDLTHWMPLPDPPAAAPTRTDAP